MRDLTYSSIDGRPKHGLACSDKYSVHFLCWGGAIMTVRCVLFIIFPTSMLLSATTTRAFQQRTIIAFTKRTRWNRATRKNSSPSDTPSVLDWDNFDFGDTPKWDTRFDPEAERAVITETQQELDDVVEEETMQDQAMARRFDRQWAAMDHLDPQLVVDAAAALSPYLQPARMDRMNQVLQKRTQHCRFLFENPTNPSNVWACLRTMDSFGLQHVDIVVESNKYMGKSALAQKKSMRTAMGSAQWLTVRNHMTTKDAVAKLKDKGYQIYASDLNPNAKDIRDIQWTDEKVCIVMGNENSGISQEMRDLADDTFILPMSGFAESFNLSVATAITLAHLSAASVTQNGPLRPGDLDEHEVNCLRLKGILQSLANKKLAKAVLNRAGLVLPEAIEWL